MSKITMNLLAKEMGIWRGTPSICVPLSHDGASSWLHLSEDGRFTFPHWRARYLRPQLTSRLLAGWLNVYARVAQAKIITLHISMVASAGGERAPAKLDHCCFSVRKLLHQQQLGRRGVGGRGTRKKANKI
jgi:hypothetical protein